MTAAAAPDFDALAHRVLYRPLAPLLARLQAGELPGLDALNRLADECVPPAVSGAGAPIRFVAGHRGGSYEESVYRCGEVPTRSADWHDFFNALVWLRFPRTKAALNRLHAREALPPRAPRGPRRDAATQFDECGIVVAGCDAALLEGLRRHQWKPVFWERRAELSCCVRFFVIGHATYDQLRVPFRGLCGKALYRGVSPAWLSLGEDDQCADLDRWLAGLTEDAERFCGPKCLAPLPLLGIPGVVPDSERAEYYDDLGQFRPLGFGR
jgi:hypothetical protein